MLTNCLWICLQKVALQIVSNIFTDYDEVNAPKAMEAVPALCNLLQYSDRMVSRINILMVSLFVSFIWENILMGR